MYHSLLQKALMLLPPETAHNIAIWGLKHKPYRHFNSPQCQPKQLWGLHFPNPIGLAAGFDKNAACSDALFAMGFGFIEVGTITPQPQSGNPKPRLFRLRQQQAIINRMGFNGLGLDAAIVNLENRKHQGILGINIGKNKITPNEQALSDYLIAQKRCHALADYMTINISSPNTPKLRALFTPAYLDELLATLKSKQIELDQAKRKPVPLLLKLSPDLDDSLLQTTIETVMKYNIDGVIATNTTVLRPIPDETPFSDETGGFSGPDLFPISFRMVEAIAQHTHKKLPIIACGGIDSPERAHAYLEAGASLLQLYTSLIYQGPKIVTKILSSL